MSASFIQGKEFGQGFSSGVFGSVGGQGISTLFNGLGENLSQGASEFLRGLNFDKIVRTLGEEMSSASSEFGRSFHFAEGAKGVGQEFAKAAGELGSEMGSASTNLFGPINASLAAQAGSFAWNMAAATLPPMIIGLALTTGVPIAIQYLYYVAVHNIGKPKLIQESRNVTMLTPISDRLSKFAGRFFPSCQPLKAFFSPEVQRRIDEISISIQNSHKHGGYMENVLLFGPGGTGKTMVAKQIAEKSGLSYVQMSGGDLAQFIKRGEHVTELNKLLKMAKSKPTVLFIDEAEGLAKDRSQMEKQEHIELLNAFLNGTGTEGKNLVIIMATNRESDLDEAVLSRLDHKIHIGPPAKAERRKIIDQAIDHLFTKAEKEQLFPDSLKEEIAQKTDGLTGRAIFKLINILFNRKAARETNTLRRAQILHLVEEHVQQETLSRKEHKKFWNMWGT